jgi:hypothetical protein
MKTKTNNEIKHIYFFPQARNQNRLQDLRIFVGQYKRRSSEKKFISTIFIADLYFIKTNIKKNIS